MKKSYLKILSLIALLAFGITVHAQNETTSAIVKMTWVDYDNPDTSNGLIADGETARSGYNKISDNSVAFANTGWGENKIAYLQVDASAVTNTIVKATLTMEVSGSSDSRRSTAWGVGYNSSTWTEDMTYNTADKSITTLGSTQSTSTKSASTFETKSFDITAALANDEDHIVTILVYETAAAGGYIKNPTVEIESTTAATTSYTVCFKDANGNELKPAVVNDNAIVGTEVSASDADMASFFNEDKTVKYVYASGNATISLAKDAAQNVITLVFREAETWTYSVVNNFGETMSTGSNWEGEAITVNFPRYVVSDTQLYGYSKYNTKNKVYCSQDITLTENNQVVNIEYVDAEQSNIIFLAEAEDIEGITLSNAANSVIRCSNGKCGYNAGPEDLAITTLNPGKYVLSTSVWGNATTTFSFKAGENEVLSVSSAGYIVDASSEEFTIEEPTTLYLAATDNAGRGVDFIYIQQTDGTPTGISDLQNEDSNNQPLFNLRGMKVQNTKGLKGLYIQNGKKVMFK